MNKGTRQFILGLLLFISGSLSILFGKLEWGDSNYIYFSLDMLVGIYTLYHSVKLIKKSIQ